MPEHYVTVIDRSGASILIACRCGWLALTIDGVFGLRKIWLDHTRGNDA